MMGLCYHSGAYCKDNLIFNVKLLVWYAISKAPYMLLTP